MERDARRRSRRAFLAALLAGSAVAAAWATEKLGYRRGLPRGRKRRVLLFLGVSAVAAATAWATDRIAISPATTRRLRWAAAALVVVAAAGSGVGWVLWHARDRTPGYTQHLRLSPSRPASLLRVGFGRGLMTPTLARPVWLAGFAKGRRATDVHDALWAVAVVIDDGEHRLGLVALDAIGLFHDDVVRVRELVARHAELDYVVVASTHNHSAPDLIGIWGPGTFRTGMDRGYRDQVVAAAASALEDAASALAPGRLSLHEIPVAPDGLVADSRDPQVFDATLRVMHFTNPTDGATLGTIVNWANHPETLWADNTEITADFPGYLRDLLESGVEVGGQQVANGLGGTHLYINGAIGGLMTTPPQTTVVDPYDHRPFTTPSHEKARAIARRLGQAILTALGAPGTTDDRPGLMILADTIELRLDNWLFRLAANLGVIDRGQPRWNRIRSEVAVIRLGQASLICVPGELYPEIANGGIVHPPGADYDTTPVEVPPLRDLAPGRVKFLVGLANDEVGYIIPKSEWDDRAPWLFDAPERHYGEINSLGSETAPTLYNALRRLLTESQQ